VAKELLTGINIDEIIKWHRVILLYCKLSWFVLIRGRANDTVFR
jgi:hypothetical protein